MTARVPKPEKYFIGKEPYYEPIGDEIEVLETAYRQKLPGLLKGLVGRYLVKGGETIWIDDQLTQHGACSFYSCMESTRMN